MADDKNALLEEIDRDRETLIDFLSRFIQARSPNPPGDTRAAAALVTQFLDANGHAYRVIDPEPTMPNVVASFDAGAPGRHLVLNGHMDVFPVGEQNWSRDPWGGEVAEGKIWGRGACDMKCGTTASIFTFVYLARIKERLKGKLTLAAVSDDETFGPWGARYLIDNHPEVHGDCALNAEPSNIHTIRFGEKGPLWVTVRVTTRGAHGAYGHATGSATKIAARLVEEFETLSELKANPPHNVASAIEQGKAAAERDMREGASESVQKVTVNIGSIHGGLKINMIPDDCAIELDIRVPVGLEKDAVMGEVEAIVVRHPEAEIETVQYSAANWCDPFGEMVGVLQDNVEQLLGHRPQPIMSLGGTDNRLWRYLGIPAYTYGPDPAPMGIADEYVTIEEFLHVVRTQVLSAYDYLSRD
jgi:succinyl-diaminopimelate desuccinylase